jgi:hypothetical protein
LRDERLSAMPPFLTDSAVAGMLAYELERQLVNSSRARARARAHRKEHLAGLGRRIPPFDRKFRQEVLPSLLVLNEETPAVQAFLG